MNKAIELLGKAVENGSNDAKLALDYLKTLDRKGDNDNSNTQSTKKLK